MEEPEPPNWICTCTVIDVMCLIDHKLLDNKMRRLATSIHYLMFPCYDFKMQLGLSYMANLEVMFTQLQDYGGIPSLGV